MFLHLYVTCDNVVTVFVDGIEKENLPNADNWEKETVLSILTTFQVIGIKCHNRDPPGHTGLSAVLKDMSGTILMQTDNTWTCFSSHVTYWRTVDFVQTDDLVSQIEVKDASTWISNELSFSADWIWTDDPADENIRCRILKKDYEKAGIEFTSMVLLRIPTAVQPMTGIILRILFQLFIDSSPVGPIKNLNSK